MGRDPQAFGRLLLHRARDERRGRPLAALAPQNLGHHERCVAHSIHHGPGRLLRFQLRIGTVDLVELGDEFLLLGLQLRLDRPILLRLELLYFALPLHQQPQSNRLNPTSRQSGLHRFPQQRTRLVSNEPVQDPPRHLGVDLSSVDRNRVLHRLRHRFLRDLVEQHPLNLRSIA